MLESPGCTDALMAVCADKGMAEVFDAVYASLHVRVSNQGAFHLYTRTLGYEYSPLHLPSMTPLSHHQQVSCCTD